MLSCQQKSTPRTRHLELIVVCTTMIYKRCNPPKADVDQRSSLRSLHVDTMFFQLVSKQAHYGCVPTNTITDAVHVHCDNASIDDMDPKSLVFVRTENLLTGKRINQAKWLRMTLRRELGWSLKFSKGPLFKKRLHFPSWTEPQNCGAWSPLPLRRRMTSQSHCSNRQLPSFLRSFTTT